MEPKSIKRWRLHFKVKARSGWSFVDISHSEARHAGHCHYHHRRRHSHHYHHKALAGLWLDGWVVGCPPPKKIGTWKRALLAFSRAKKRHFERPNLRTESKNLAKHPPKWLGRHLGNAFPFSGEYQAKFWKSCFRALWSPFYTLKRPISKNGWQIFVYGSIILNFFLVVLLAY